MKRILLLLAACGIAFAQQAQPEKVAQVMKGELKEARASWWGFDAEDSTEPLQAAISSNVPKLVIDKMPSAWIVGKTLALVSNQELVLEEGTEILAKKGAFKGVGESLARIDLKENVTIRGEGKGATLRMRKADYHTEEYKKSEWRHAICVRSSKNIQLLNLALVESGGDGVYLGICKPGVPPTDIVIRDVVCDGNNRQGISVIASVNLLIENCKLINTKGTPPASGIDFEPNRSNEPLRNILMRNCTLYNNEGDGFHFFLPKMDAASGPLEITIENCTSRDEKKSCLHFRGSNGPTKTMQGHVIFRNCEFENCSEPIRVKGTSSYGYKTLFENVTMKGIGQASPTKAPIILGGDALDEEPSGNIHFKNVTIHETVERNTLAIEQNGMVGGLENISGAITVVTNGKRQELPFTNEWAKANYPPHALYKAPDYPMEGVTMVPLAASFEDTEFSKISLRHKSQFLIHANRGDEIRFGIFFGQLGKYQAKEAAVTWFTPSGKKKLLEPAPFKEAKEYCIQDAPEDGLYTLEVNCGPNWSYLTHANRPVMIHADSHITQFCKGVGDVYFYVPPKTPAFCINFNGEGSEGLKATIFDSDGKQVWQKDDISLLEQFCDDKEIAQKGGVFRIVIEKPTHLITLEDYYIRIFGIPPYLGLAPNLLLKPVK